MVANNNQLIGFKEICEMLTLKSTATHKLIDTDPTFPSFKMGGKIVAYPDDIDSWIKAQRDKQMKEKRKLC